MWFQPRVRLWTHGWGSESDLDACLGFRCSKKVEKHWPRPKFEAKLLMYTRDMAKEVSWKNRKQEKKLSSALSCYKWWQRKHKKSLISKMSNLLHKFLLIFLFQVFDSLDNALPYHVSHCVQILQTIAHRK